MGEFESYLCRTFYTWMARFLRRMYAGVEIVFIVCHTEAREVDEETFFHAGSSGGTRLASAYELALEIVDQRYDPANWNIYPFLFSDGFNWGDRECVDLVQRFLKVSNLVGYGEIDNYGYWSEHPSVSRSASGNPLKEAAWAPLGRAYLDAFRDESQFVMVRLTGKNDVWPALRQFMARRHGELAV
jgi:uncharacterized sporulation protein YeaH/YhbH (DUF444 family)